MHEQLMDDLKKRLSPERYAHTLRVCEMAKELAARHGEDLERVTLAALCHDYAKCLDHRRYPEIAQAHGITLDEYMLADLGLAHGLVGAALVQSHYAVEDREVLDAITYHTYGRPAMTRIEEIIYLADYVEFGRDFPGVVQIRETALDDLDRGMLLALMSTIAYVESRRKQVHPLSREALKYYQERVGK